MIFPYNTDAPIYHWPFITVGLVVVNVLVFFSFFTNDMAGAEDWVLIYGEFNPIQWVTSNFMHATPMHLIGNMLFLWGFGLVVEGKVGWWKFLLIYFGIGIVECAGEQMLMGMLGVRGGSLGASSILYGLMAISWVWAPKNEMECIFYYGVVRTFSVSIVVFGSCYIGLEVLMAFMGGFAVSSSVLHLAGALPGFAVGFAMLKLDMVDCEGWDILSVWQGKTEVKLISEMDGPATTNADAALNNHAANFAGAAAGVAAQAIDNSESNTHLGMSPEPADVEIAREKMQQALLHGELELALKIHHQMSQIVSDWQLNREELTGIVRLMHARKLWDESVPFMEEYVAKIPDTSGRVRLKLAQIYILQQERPQKGLALLKQIRPGGLEKEVVQTRENLMIKAKGMIESGTLELADD